MPESIEKELAQMNSEFQAEASGQAQQGKCPFCEIAKGAIPAKKVYEDENTIAFLDINPRNPGHTLVVPKKHFATILDIPVEDAGELFKAVKKIAVAVQSGMKAQGVSISQSNGSAAGQLVPHMHFHVIPRFLSEGPMALEGVLPVKKMPEQTLDKVVDVVKSGFGKAPAPAREAPRAEKEEAPEEKEGEIDFDF